MRQLLVDAVGLARDTHERLVVVPVEPSARAALPRCGHGLRGTECFVLWQESGDEILSFGESGIDVLCDRHVERDCLKGCHTPEDVDGHLRPCERDGIAFDRTEHLDWFGVLEERNTGTLGVDVAVHVHAVAPARIWLKHHVAPGTPIAGHLAGRVVGVKLIRATELLGDREWTVGDVESDELHRVTGVAIGVLPVLTELEGRGAVQIEIRADTVMHGGDEQDRISRFDGAREPHVEVRGTRNGSEYQ